jgi:Glyceraldehyde 3-phosphate dehydrogenase, C-terminal domain/Transaldolase/Fructose-6-phosphate aldolase
MAEIRPLQRLAGLGQLVWIDYLSRDLLESGKLAGLAGDGAVSGVASNPTIFEQAISQGSAHDEQLRGLSGSGLDVKELFSELSQPATGDEVKSAFRQAAERAPLAGILRYADLPLVSSDIVHSPDSCIFDSELTMSEGRLVEVFGWYDSERGYSCRLVDLVGRLQ